MATRSTIAKVMNDGSIKLIYCHWDGYLSNNGNLLLEYYNTADKVDQLLELGDLSSLRPRISPDANEVHNFDNPLEDVCIAYGRDRNEINTQARIYKKSTSIIKRDPEEFNYIFKDGKWFYRAYVGREIELVKVEE